MQKPSCKKMTDAYIELLHVEFYFIHSCSAILQSWLSLQYKADFTSVLKSKLAPFTLYGL